jgi:uncharacterized protein (TIGR03067 family)
MLRGALLLGLFACALGLTLAADPKPADDLAGLQGNWKPLQCEFDGKPQIPTDKLGQVTAVYEKNEYFLYYVGKDKAGNPAPLLLAQTNVKLDQTTNPKGIVFEFADGPLKGVKRHGIYELAGNQLKLCYGPIEKPRPTEFKSTPDNGYFLETWARQVK